MPRIPPNAVGRSRLDEYEVRTRQDKMVADWANISIAEARELDVIEWMEFRHDAVIDAYMSTGEGRKLLEDALRYAETKPDRESLRRAFG